MTLLIILLLIIFLLWYFNPKIDETSEGELLLWIGPKDNRKYINLSKIL